MKSFYTYRKNYSINGFFLSGKDDAQQKEKKSCSTISIFLVNIFCFCIIVENLGELEIRKPWTAVLSFSFFDNVEILSAGRAGDKVSGCCVMLAVKFFLSYESG